MLNENFPTWRAQFGLFQDKSGLWRFRGRLQNVDLPIFAKHPVLLDRKHHLTRLIINEAHQRVQHNRVKETLTKSAVNIGLWVVEVWLDHTFTSVSYVGDLKGNRLVDLQPRHFLPSELIKLLHSLTLQLTLLDHFTFETREFLAAVRFGCVYSRVVLLGQSILN